MKHKIYQALDGIGESSSPCVQLLSKVRSVQMVKLTVGDAGAGSGRTKRKLAKLGITSPYVCEPAPGLKLAKVLPYLECVRSSCLFPRELSFISMPFDPSVEASPRALHSSLGSRKLQDGDDGLAALCRFLRSAANLNDLSVAGNRLSERSAPQIASLLKHPPHCAMTCSGRDVFVMDRHRR